ncbi:hypothetical protein [Pseudozobellia thermophila]|uniref:Lipocalin-like domain-containing protein n=1 Tax=Pseudozobellia thermophila TaxID=192903 RepID=A0A1M6HGE4_9FLAO|nr:hypothetical protein [Pseudozobellia thermophila]SHJ21243.1 hypothetical protein SAMN04488513_10341 [Pseudozobellia thermophila]
MKKVFSFFAIIAIVLASNCSKIPENNDEVIGIWSNVDVQPSSLTAKEQTVKHEWIFNDAYLGRYHEKVNGSITFKTDFEWSAENDVYTIKYPGTDMQDQTLSLVKSGEVTSLADTAGHTVAIRE